MAEAALVVSAVSEAALGGKGQQKDDQLLWMANLAEMVRRGRARTERAN